MKLQYSNLIFWVYGLFGLAAIAIFFCFPENDLVKYGFLLLAFIAGLVVPQFYRENDIGESGVRFSLKAPSHSFVPLLVAFILCTTFMISDGVIGYLAVLYGLILMASNLIMLFFLPAAHQNISK